MVRQIAREHERPSFALSITPSPPAVGEDTLVLPASADTNVGDRPAPSLSVVSAEPGRTRWSSPTAGGVIGQAEIDALADELEGQSAKAVLRWGMQTFGEQLALCTSFQADGMVLLDLAWRIDPAVRVFTIDTSRLPAETYALIDQVRERYGIAIEVYSPDAAELESFVRAEGVNPFYRSLPLRLQCCAIRKVQPLKRVLSGLDAWVTGLRREQSASRANVRVVELDTEHDGIVKLNPLAGWSEAQVWAHIREHDVPYNPLYDQGYTSIGCAPCTRPIAPGEDGRAGRWWWEQDTVKECGMHCSIESGSLQRRLRETVMCDA